MMFHSMLELYWSGKCIFYFKAMFYNKIVTVYINKIQKKSEDCLFRFLFNHLESQSILPNKTGMIIKKDMSLDMGAALIGGLAKHNQRTYNPLIFRPGPKQEIE